jgi:anti-anti-sigma factor
VTNRGGVTVVALAGEIDLYNVEAVRATLHKECGPRARLSYSISGVACTDATTIGVFLEAQSRLNGHDLLLVAPPPHLRRTLELCGVDGRLPVYATLADALSAKRREDIASHESRPNVRPGAATTPTRFS